MKISEALRVLSNPVVIYPELVRVFGVQESVFLAQLIYWTGKGSDPSGWIYKTAKEISEETGLTYDQQLRVRNVLAGKQRYGWRGKRLRQVQTEPVLEEKWKPNEHRIYFRVNFEALDRAFSENLFSKMNSGQTGLFPNAMLRGKSKESLGSSQPRHWEVPKSLYNRDYTTEITKEKTAVGAEKKSPHRQFVGFWNRTVRKTRGKKPAFDKADMRNLKLALTIISEERLEQLGLYFLAAPSFRRFDPRISVFLSEGIMDSLAKKERQQGFWKAVDLFARQYVGADLLKRSPAEEAALRDLIAELREKFKIKQ